MKRFALSSLLLSMIVALGVTACSGGMADSGAAFSAAMDSADAPGPLSKGSAARPAP